MSRVMEGGCACGHARYSVKVDDDDAYLCHCRMCQRATGGVSIAFKQVLKADVTWANGPAWYQSSDIARRPFCDRCGTPLGFEYPDSPKMDLTVGSFDDPSGFVPKHHFGAEAMHRDWIDTRGLPEMRSDTYAPLVQRWKDAGGPGPA